MEGAWFQSALLVLLCMYVILKYKAQHFHIIITPGEKEMFLDCFILQFYSSDPEKGSLHFLTLVELALIREVDKGSVALL